MAELINLSVLTAGDVKAASALAKQLENLKIKLEDIAVASTKFNVESGDFVTKLVGITKAGQNVTVVLKSVEGVLKADTVALQNNAKATKDALIAKAEFIKRQRAIADAKSLIGVQFDTAGYKPHELSRHREQTTQILGLISKSKDGYSEFHTALNATVSGVTDGLTLTEQKYYNILQRMTDKNLSVLDKFAKDSKAKADKLAAQAKRKDDTNIARAELTGKFNTKNLSIQQLQSFENKLESLYRGIEIGTVKFDHFADAIDVHFGGALKDIDPKAKQLIQLFRTLNSTVSSADKKVLDQDTKKQDKIDTKRRRALDARDVRKDLEKHFTTAGFSPEQVVAQQARFGTIAKSVAKGTTDAMQFGHALTAFFTKSAAGLGEEAQQILKILNTINNYQTKIQNKLLKKGDATHAKGTIDALRLTGAFDTKNLSVTQAQKLENTLNTLYRQVGKGTLDFKNFQAALDSYFKGLGGTITPEVQQIISIFQTLDATITSANKKKFDRDKVKSDKVAKNATQQREAQHARADLESLFPKTGLNAEQSTAQDARVNAIVRSVRKGNTSLKQFNDAIKAYFSGFTAGLDEESQKVLKVVNNIVNYQNKVTSQNKKKADAATTKATNEKGGKILLDAEKKNAAGNFARLDPGAQERVRNQFDRIQALFSKGLNVSGFVKAFQVANQGATHELDKTEREVRHRLERINIELGKGNRKPVLSQYFGGGDDGGSGSISTNWIKGAIFAQGISKIVNEFQAAIEKSAEFSRQVALIRTITQDADVSTAKWSQSLAQVSNVIGRSRDEVAQAGYDLLSNQITKGADSFQVLVHAGNLANTTNSTLVSSVNILSSAIQSFGLRATDTEKLAAAFFTTIDLGRVKIEEISDVFGRPALAAKTLGVSFQELAASIITISQTGINVEQTNTLITNVFHKLINPTKELQALYDKLGVSTGEMFVKTYGFTGVLKILQRETGGSVAKLSELFNEIRGEQGINALIDRLGIYEDALDKVTNSTEKYKAAIDEVNASSGQKFKVEIQKIENYFHSWKDMLLDITVKLGEWNGGLANTVTEVTTFSSVILGGGTALLLLTNRFDTLLISSGVLQKALVALRLQAATLAPVLAGAFAAFEIGNFLGTLYAIDHEYQHFYENRRAELEEFREKADKESERIAEAFAKPFKELNKAYQGDILQGFGNVIANFKKIEDAEKEAFKDSGKAFENSAQVFITGLKKKLDEVQAKIKEIDDLAKDYNKNVKTTRDKRQSFIYDYAHKVNDLNVQHGYGDQSKEIDEKRLQQLRANAAKADNDPDLTSKQKAEEINRNYEEREKILEHMATLTYTDPFTGQTELVYSVQKSTDRLKANDNERLYILHRQNKALEAQKGILKEVQKKQQTEIKDAEDAIAKIAHFKAFDDGTGKLRKGSVKATLKEFDEQAEEALAKIEEARKHGHGTAGDVLNLKERFRAERAQLEKTLDVHTKRTQTEDLRTAQAKAADPAHLKALQDASVTADKEKNRSQATVQGYSENLVVQGKEDLERNHSTSDDLGGSVNTASPFRKKFQEQIEGAQYYVERGEHEKAIPYYDAARRLAKQGGFENQPIAGPSQEVYKDGKPTGEKVSQPSTFGTQVTQARAAASTAAESSKAAKETGKAWRDAEKESSDLLAEMTNIVREYGTLQLSTDRFAELSKAAWDASVANVGRVNEELKGTIDKLDEIGKKAIETAGKIAQIDSGVSQQLSQAQRAAAQIGGGSQPSVKAPGEFTGGLIHRADGGLIYSPKGSDNIPLLAANHEFMMNQQSTSRFLPQLIAMNSGFEPSFAQQSQRSSGDHYNFGDMHINVGGGGSGHQTAKDIVSGIKRGIRRGTLSI